MFISVSFTPDSPLWYCTEDSLWYESMRDRAGVNKLIAHTSLINLSVGTETGRKWGLKLLRYDLLSPPSVAPLTRNRTSNFTGISPLRLRVLVKVWVYLRCKYYAFCFIVLSKISSLLVTSCLKASLAVKNYLENISLKFWNLER